MRTIVQFRVPELAETNDDKFTRPGRKDPSMAPRIVVVSPIRVYREGLAQMLAQQSSISVVGAAARVNDLTHLFTESGRKAWTHRPDDDSREADSRRDPAPSGASLRQRLRSGHAIIPAARAGAA